MNKYDFVIKIIQEAGELLMRRSKEGFKVVTKSGDFRDIVTSVDMEVNKLIIDTIQKKFPEDSIYSEESGFLKEASDNLWVIDPIDGSANFSRGIPHFAICLGFIEKSIPVVGAVYNPVIKELFSFKKGSGAFLNNKPIHVSEITDIAQAHVFFHAGRKKELREWGGESYRRLLEYAKKTSNFSSSSLDACFVAMGRIEANIYGTLSTLDIASAFGILIEAGGVIAGIDKDSFKISRNPQKIFMANNKEILSALRVII